MSGARTAADDGASPGYRPGVYEDRTAIANAVAAGEHRALVGGLWDELGTLQLRFLTEQGLKPHHTFVDIGCGAFRAGVKLVPYLDVGNYYGIDVSPELLDAGYEEEIASAGLAARLPRENVSATATFDVSTFGVAFDYALAQSVFTHLPLSAFDRCLRALRPHMRAGGVVFSTWFVAPHRSRRPSRHTQPHGLQTFHDRDPYHASVDVIVQATRGAGWVPVWIGDWNHPRHQQMLAAVAP
ncbi:MAG TPA: class I SAM-dependent methyltransferase [Gaiellaceae bacterium]|nr:class I SAM-dependent methyltransferase [Gaiellaceae bacterium]